LTLVPWSTILNPSTGFSKRRALGLDIRIIDAVNNHLTSHPSQCNEVNLL
jgi:hypothetical protein